MTEERPSWGYQRLIGERMRRARSALDIQTGGGEVLAGVPTFPPLMVATESWPPNVAAATALLNPLGVVVVADDEPPLPFADSAFDLVTSRHPVTVWWDEIARVLEPGGTYLAQHVGPASVFELVEYFMGRKRRRSGGHGIRTMRAVALRRRVWTLSKSVLSRCGVLRCRGGDLLSPQGDLDGPGLHGAGLPRPTSPAPREHRIRWALRRALHPIPRRGTEPRLTRAASPPRDS